MIKTHTYKKKEVGTICKVCLTENMRQCDCTDEDDYVYDPKNWTSYEKEIVSTVTYSDHDGIA